jgi:voltage-gated potassium channel
VLTDVKEHRARRMIDRATTARGAAVVIVCGIVAVTIASALVMRVADPVTFETIGESFWWAAQTSTTIGYGDVVPESSAGRAVAVLLMIGGVALITILTAAVTAIFVESARSRIRRLDPHLENRFDDVGERLDRIEALLRERRADHSR